MLIENHPVNISHDLRFEENTFAVALKLTGH